MSCYVSHTTFDCHDAYALSEWWKALLGYADLDGDPNQPGDDECMIHDPESGHRLLFVEVPEGELPAKRLHLDLAARSGTRDEEITRIRTLGATKVADRREDGGLRRGWVTFADPEGNQFCVVRSAREVAAMNS